MSDTELLEAGLDTLFATFAVGALLFPLTLISVTALAYLRNSVGEGWGPRWEAGAAFRVSVLVALWVPVVGLLTGYEWWNSDLLRGYGILILVAIATRAFVRAVWQASRDSLAELSGRVRGSLASRDPEIDDRASLRKHKERLEAKVRWLEHEDLGISHRMGLFARLKDRRIERALRRTEAELQRVDARLAGLEDDPLAVTPGGREERARSTVTSRARFSAFSGAAHAPHADARAARGGQPRNDRALCWSAGAAGPQARLGAQSGKARRAE